MNRCYVFALVVITTLCVCLASTATEEGSPRIITLDGVTTEILFALGAGGDLVGRPESAVYPEEARNVASIGSEYYFNVESVLGLRPNMIIAVDHPYSRRNESEQQLARSGVKMVSVPYATNLDLAVERVRLIAETVGRVDAGNAIIDKMRRELEEIKTKVAERKSQGLPSPRLACMLLTERGAFVLGRAGAPVALAEVCGAVSVFGDGTPSPLNAEAFSAAKPDVILVYSGELKRLGGLDKLLALPGVGLTPAGQNKHIVAMDYELLSGWGPRVGIAAQRLLHDFYEVVGPSVDEHN